MSAGPPDDKGGEDTFDWATCHGTETTDDRKIAACCSTVINKLNPEGESIFYGFEY